MAYALANGDVVQACKRFVSIEEATQSVKPHRAECEFLSQMPEDWIKNGCARIAKTHLAHLSFFTGVMRCGAEYEAGLKQNDLFRHLAHKE
ncbi:unnamed protein product [Clonostachys solani]|uniref:Uncharacterized protein n=1 Tax=Clonostachys solani TaxID=160281 RepID=A0A9N9Z288_9HYPO|nr:unnamed protein product [Clonostachys solani]